MGAQIQCTHQAETKIVVTIPRRIVVAIGRAQVLRIVVPGAAPNNAVRDRFGHYAKFKELSNSFLRIIPEFA